jgi:hypothetical protein
MIRTAVAVRCANRLPVNAAGWVLISRSCRSKSEKVRVCRVRFPCLIPRWPAPRFMICIMLMHCAMLLLKGKMELVAHCSMVAAVGQIVLQRRLHLLPCPVPLPCELNLVMHLE